jgi:hypothetical protein
VVAEPADRLPAVLLKFTLLPLNGLPPAVRVAVILLVVTPSAAIDIGAAPIVTVTARSVIVVVGVNPLYAAVTVALPSLLTTGAVYVTAIALDELAGDEGETLPLVALTAAVAPEIAPPPFA